MDISALLHVVGGSLVAPVFQYFNKRQDNKHEKDMRVEDRRMVAEEAKAKVEVAREEARGAEEAANAAIYQKSYDDASSFLTAGKDLPKWASAMLAFVDVVKQLTRPGLTIALVVYCWQQSLTGSFEAMMQIAVGWWFGTRFTEKPNAPRPIINDVWGYTTAKNLPGKPLTKGK